MNLSRNAEVLKCYVWEFYEINSAAKTTAVVDFLNRFILVLNSNSKSPWREYLGERLRGGMQKKQCVPSFLSCYILLCAKKCVPLHSKLQVADSRKEGFPRAYSGISVRSKSPLLPCNQLIINHITQTFSMVCGKRNISFTQDWQLKLPNQIIGHGSCWLPHHRSRRNTACYRRIWLRSNMAFLFPSGFLYLIRPWHLLVPLMSIR